MKYACLLFLFLLNVSLAGQNLRVEYQAELKDLEQPLKGPNEDFIKMKKLMHKRAQETLPHVRFSLVANHEAYKFYYEPVMLSDKVQELDVNRSISKAMDGAAIYGNLEENASYYFPRALSLIRKVPLDQVEWTITKESKTILSYRCYLATASLQDKKAEYGKMVPLTAWFCPTLNFQAGPTAYASLPGTILEMELPEVIFKAKKVKSGAYDVETLPENNMKILPHEEFVAYYEVWSKTNLPRN